MGSVWGQRTSSVQNHQATTDDTAEGQNPHVNYDAVLGLSLNS